MPTTGLHHINLRIGAAELQRLRDFYCDVVELLPGPRPPFQSAGVWLYAGATPVLHLTQMHTGEVVAAGAVNALPTPAERLSAIDHIALAATDLAEALRRLALHGVAYTLTEVPALGETQILFRDPSGNGVELIFPLMSQS